MLKIEPSSSYLTSFTSQLLATPPPPRRLLGTKLWSYLCLLFSILHLIIGNSIDPSFKIHLDSDHFAPTPLPLTIPGEPPPYFLPWTSLLISLLLPCILPNDRFKTDQICPSFAQNSPVALYITQSESQFPKNSLPGLVFLCPLSPSSSFTPFQGFLAFP